VNTTKAILASTDCSLGKMYLYGLTNYGDSVEDEWLIVYILRELSNRFPQLWIKVVDTDGEFLLVEAANALPRWLTPEIADNRVSATYLAIKIKMADHGRFGFTIMHSALYLSVQTHTLVRRLLQLPEP
jgi:hypothetical protein